MALYNIFVPGVHITAEDVNQAGEIVGGLTADPLIGTLFQGVTGASAALALTALEGAFVYNFDSQTHVYLQSSDNLD